MLFQAGPAGIFSHTEVFSCIYNTLRQVFKCKCLPREKKRLFFPIKFFLVQYKVLLTSIASNSPSFLLFADVVPYSAHIPSYADIWGWVMVNIADD